ncbi:trinucleotide repeat-containing gene 6B protein isoform X2 [Triplophysa rosa]|uniref:trinucleotide repeat-containing gene 6B protein isoform X2 n=1 Tax=Triplophysa rosa TaxID=992332 RepID=UPI002545CF4C|nr:trinucleotide repeat-containing gene 6B protein isoform X2 [Triplophysa rosa]
MEDRHCKTEDSAHQEGTKDSIKALSPCPAVGGSSDPPEGGNNAKWTTVANGQPPSAVSQRYMPREVPPRFRNQQEPKVLLKRGQPPLSCMLLGGGPGGDVTPSPNASTADASDATVSLHSSSDASVTPIYANHSWGIGSGGQSSAQGMEKIVVDGADSEKWPSVEGSAAQVYSSSWNRDQRATAGPRMDGSSSLCEYSDTSAVEGLSSPAQNKETDQSVDSKAPSSAGDEDGPRGLNPSSWTADPDGGPLPITASEEPPPTPLSQAGAPYQTLGNKEWAELKAGPNDDRKEGGVTRAEPAGEKDGGSGGREMRGSNEHTSTGWTSDSVGVSGEDVRDGSRASAARLQDSVLANDSVKSRDDNQRSVRDWDGVEGESARSDDGTRIQTDRAEETLQTMISRSNLDPRVLCNTGWGKTQIKQTVAWNLELDSENVCKEGWKSPGDAPLPRSKLQKQEGPEVCQGQGWRDDEWIEKTAVKRDGWGTRGEVRTGGWGEAQDDDSSCKRERVGWDQSSRRERGQTTPLPEPKGDCKDQAEGLWGSSEETGGWRGEKQLPSQIPNKQTTLKTQIQQQPQPQMAGPPKTSQDRGHPESQNKGSGWTSGPIPQIPSATESSGWDEPSPQSVSRKMEIDDGTSAWGDPSRYSRNNVNLWDKNGSKTQQQSCQSSGRQAAAPSKNPAPSTWGHSGGPSDESVDGGTGAWGKSLDAASNWEESEETGGGWGTSRSHANKSGSKSMQESWGDEGSVTSRHSSWEEEDGGTGVWGNRGPQSSMSSYNSGSWGQSHGGRRHNTQSPLKGNSGDSWSTPVTRQFSNMNIMDEDSSSVSQDRHDRRGMNDGEMRRGGRAGASFRSQNSKDITPGESGPYMDRVGGHAVFGSGGISQLRGVHQTGVHPFSRSPVIRAPVPQFLPPPVAGPMLKPMAPPGGGMFPPQLSPQHMAMLGGVHPHMQQFQLACQLLLQQQQQQQQFLNQRKFPAPPRQQPDAQQLARIMAILQQQGVGGGKLPSSPMGGPVPKHPETPPLHHLNKPLDTPLHAVMGGSDLHNKPSAAYTGFAGGSDLDSLIGGLKDGGGAQSRFKWMMDGNSMTPSPPEVTLHNGPVKLGGGSSYPQYDVLGGSWHRSAAGKVDTSPVNTTWPPEFQPGVPWKGVQSPEPSPYMTSAGMMGPSVLSDPEHQLLQDNTGSNSLNTRLPSPGAWPYSTSDPSHTAHTSVKSSELKSSWPPEPIGHSKSWRTNRNTSHQPRPPPGLSNQKQSWSGEGPQMPRGWGGETGSQESPFKPEWSDGGAGKSWLLLRNLTPQIDGSTLKTICLQHGPLLTFHLGLTPGTALIRYSSPHEAANAQSALHMCVLGNTTILAEFMSDDDVIRYFTHSQTTGVTGSPEGSSGSDPASREGVGGDEEAAVRMTSAGWQGLDVSGGSGPEGLALLSQWSNSSQEGAGKGFWGGVAPGYHSSSLWGTSQMEDGPAALLPGNLLGGGADSL